MIETGIIAMKGASSAPMKRFVFNNEVPLQGEIVRERMISARIMNGLSAVEAASRLGYANSTQLSLIESGERKVPNDWQFLLKVSQVYSVSMDYLVGASSNPERDAIASEHFALMRGFEQLQQMQAAAMTTAFIKYGAQGKPSSSDMESLCNSVETITGAVQTMRDRSPTFDDMRGGATVLASSIRLKAAIVPIREALRRRKENEQHFIDLASGKEGPLSYLTDDNYDIDLEKQNAQS